MYFINCFVYCTALQSSLSCYIETQKVSKFIIIIYYPIIQLNVPIINTNELYTIGRMLLFFVCIVGKSFQRRSFYETLRKSTSNECITTGGKTPRLPCKFPFIYDVYYDIPYVPASILRWFSTTVKFETCTDYRMLTTKWCATKVTSGNHYISGHWGTCPDTIVCNEIGGSASNL